MATSAARVAAGDPRPIRPALSLRAMQDTFSASYGDESNETPAGVDTIRTTPRAGDRDRRMAAVGMRPSAARLPIDRRALVSRHDVTLTRLDPESPLSVGNGEFAFDVGRDRPPDVPGALRTDDPAGHALTVGLAHGANPTEVEHRSLRLQGVQQSWPDGRVRRHSRRAHAGSRVAPREPAQAASWTPRVPLCACRWHRGDTSRPDGHPPDLDLWNGTIVSHFRFDGEAVDVETMAHPELDAVSVVRASSRLIRTAARDRVAVPYGTGQMSADWRSRTPTQPEW